MLPPRVAYLWRQMLGHASLFFSDEVRARLEEGSVRFLSYDAAVHHSGPAIVIPIDVPAPADPVLPYRVPFNDSHLTLWNRLPVPSAPGWRAFPGEAAPLWYLNDAGTIMPAWNLFATLFDLLTFREERDSALRDSHGRFVGRFSPRCAKGLLEVPAFNEAVAAIASASLGLHAGGLPLMKLDGQVRSPAVVLSHDCDVLFGNDVWTQWIRAFRVVRPLAQGRLPRPGNFWWIARNALSPRRFYFDNVLGMMDLERQFGYTSTLYLLSGTGGRFGARNGTRGLGELVVEVPKGWDVGIHYNYDTFLNRERFLAQQDELGRIIGRKPVTGRAHYLRFDTEQSFPFLEASGIVADESAGYSDYLGYRNGLGGCYEAYDLAHERALNICEIPMVIMDTTLVEEYGNQSLETVQRLLTHLRRVGGALSIIFHPGVFHNPEFPEMMGVYRRILKECQKQGARSETAATLGHAFRARSPKAAFTA